MRFEPLESRDLLTVLFSFTNNDAISFPATVAPGDPYPSTIEVSALPATVAEVTVDIHDFSADEILDASILLAGPDLSNNVMLMRWVGTGVAANQNYRFQDGAVEMPFLGVVPDGTYSPTDHDSGDMPGPAPAEPYGDQLSVFNGLSPNGTWSLYVANQQGTGGTGGSLAGGWTLNIQIDPATFEYDASDNPGITEYTLRLDATGDILQVVETADPDNVLSEQLLAATWDVQILGLVDADDTLTVDFVNGDPIPDGGLQFDAGYDAGDTLAITGGPAGSVTHSFTNANDGTVDIDGSTIAYTGLAPIFDNLNAANRVFQYSGADDTVILRDDADNNNGLMVIEAPGTAETVVFQVPTNSLTVNLGAGNDILEVRSFDSQWAAPTINLDGEDGADEIRLAATPAGTTTNVDLNTGVPDWAVLGAIVGDPDNAAISVAQFNTGNSTLDLIQGTVNVRDSGTVGSLYVDDSGNTDDTSVTVTDSAITGLTPNPINYVPGEIQDVVLALGSGDDAINVVSTGAPDDAPFGFGTVIYGNDGDDTFTIAGDGLSGFNTFHGGGGNDQFVLNIVDHIGASGTYPILGLEIHGDDPAGDSIQRDRLIVNDNNSGFVRNLNYQYDAANPGGVDIRPNAANAGLFGTAGHDLVVRTMETVVFNSLDTNDVVQVTGTAEDDLMTVGLLPNAHSALFFLGGTPYLDSPPATVAGSLPGVAGGGSGPDLLINGLAGPTGITLDGGGASGDGDRAIVYAASESALLDTGNPTDIFGSGFGSGVLIPGFGAGNAFDTMTVDDSGVSTTNSLVGPLARVNLNTASFQQNLPAEPTQRAALIVNGGDEASLQTDGTADVFHVTPSTWFNIQVNGNLPDPAGFLNGVPQGDQLHVDFAGSVNVFSDDQSPPNVTVTGQSSDFDSPFGVRYRSVERLHLTPGNGIVNIIGDNNIPGGDQNDYFKVRGDANPLLQPPPQNLSGNQFSLQIGGSWEPGTGDVGTPPAAGLSSPIWFSDVTRINALGGAASGYDPHGNALADSVSPAGVNALDLTPYADNTPNGWGIETYWWQGNPIPSGGMPNDDLLVYHGVPGVSEEIVIQPATPLGGQLFSNNAATGTPIAVINYLFNTDIIVHGNDGALGDTDNLVLRGTDPANPSTSGSENFVIDLDAEGTGSDPVVRVTDADNGDLLFQVQEFTNLSTLTIEALGGHDTITVLGQNVESILPARLSGLNVFGGEGDDTLILDNSNGLVDLTNGIFFDGGPGNDRLELRGDLEVDAAVYTVGPGVDEGFVRHTRDGALQRVDFAGLAPVIDLVPAATLTVNATGADNAISYAQSELNPDWGQVSIDGFEPIHFANKEELIIHALGGSDTISLNNPTTPTGLTEITVDGGDPTASDVVIVNVATAAVVSNLTVDSATITRTGEATVQVTGAEHLILVGDGSTDLTVEGTAGANTIVHTPGAADDSGAVRVDSLLPIRYQNLGVGATLTIDGNGGNDRLVVEGTVADDAFGVASGSGQVSLNSRVVISQQSIEHLVLLGLDGDDVFHVDGDHPFDSVAIEGGNPAASDVLNFTGSGGDVTIDLEARTVTELGFEPVTFSGVEIINVVAANADVFVEGTAGDDEISYTPTGTDAGTLVLAGLNAVFHVSEVGTLTLDPLDGVDTVTVSGTSGDDDIAITRNATDTLVTLAGRQALNVVTANTQSLVVDGSLGDDTLTVDVTGTDLIGVPIVFHGDNGNDTLVVSGTPSVTVNSVTYTPGPTSDAGRLEYGSTGTDMLLHFTGLTPVVDSVPAAQLIVNGNQGDNVISYRESGLNSDWDQVSIDNFEVIHFENKTELVINALAGDNRVNLNNLAPSAALQEIIVFGGDGNDRITTSEGVAANVQFFGGAGDDVLDASGVQSGYWAYLYGGPGNDLLIGGLGDDTLLGGPGDDTLVSSSGDDTYDGGPGFNTLLVQGTPGNDRIDAHQTAANTLVLEVNGDVRNETVNNVQEVRIQAGAGNDVIRVNVADALVATPQDSLRFHVVGGPSTTGDRLAVVDDGLGDLVIHRVGADGQSGSITVGPLAPVVYEQIDFVQVVPLDPITGGTGTDGEGRLVVFKPDPFESNNSLPNATFLGSGATINVDPVIDPGADVPFGLPGDEDWFRVVAEKTGVLDFQVYFTVIGTLDNGRAGLPGDGVLQTEVYDVAGNAVPVSFRATGNEGARVRIPAVAGQSYYLRVSGAEPEAINVYSMTIHNTAPPVPYDLELQDTPVFPGDDANSDTGRSQFDNITRDDTPTIWFRLDDAIFEHDLPGNPAPGNPPVGVIPIPFDPEQAADPSAAGYRVAVFVEGLPQQPGQLPQEPVGYARLVDAGVYEFSFETDALNAPFELEDGSHFISARVQMIDPADPLQTGFGDRSVSLEIIVDTAPPPISFGQPGVVGDGLHPDSDSGVAGPNNQATWSDRITNDTTPTFWGRAEANAIVRAYLDVNGNGVVDSQDIFLGMTVAMPLDGSNQFPGGYWELTSLVDLNDPATSNLDDDPVALPLDGLRQILVTAEDVAGNVSEPQTLDIFIDTQGPQIEGVHITDAPTFDLFDVKPSQGPTPLTYSLTIEVSDQPNRVAGFLYSALASGEEGNPVEHLGHYQVRGDHNGLVVIESVEFIPDTAVAGQAATGQIVLRFADPLPDDRFTLTVSDALVDPAGNALDGESNAAEPSGGPQFPTGDGQPGGAFVARFTIDSRAEIGVWAAGSVYIDTNGNFVHDPHGKDGDHVNRDITYMFGRASDNIFAGNFALPGDPADGFHKLAAYGRFGGSHRWLIDTDNTGVPNLDLPDGLSIDGLPLAGRFWDGVVRNGIQIDQESDQVGVKKGTTWYLDTNANLVIDANDAVLAGNMPGMPIVGDFDGDGIDDLGSWIDGVFYIDLSSVRTNGPVNPDSYHPNINGFWDVKFDFGFTGVRERPFAADFDGDGIDDLGLWVPDRSGATPAELAEWYILTSGFEGTLFARAGYSFANLEALTQPTQLQMPFKPWPFGTDIYAQFGDNFALPVVGNFDPPVVPLEGGAAGPLRATNPDNPLDVSGTGGVSPLDALLVINVLNHHQDYLDQGAFNYLSGVYPDVNGDGVISPLDVLQVINHLNWRAAAVAGEGESWGTVAANLTLDPPQPADARPLSPSSEGLQTVAPVVNESDEPRAFPAADLFFAELSQTADREYPDSLAAPMSDDSDALLGDLLDELVQAVADGWS